MNQLHILYAVSALMDVAIVAAMFALSRRAAELGAGALELGLLGGAWLGIYSLCAPWGGKLSDRMNRRTLAAAGAVLGGVTVFVCAFVTSVPLLVLITGGMGIGVAVFWPSLIAGVGEGLSGPLLANRMSQFSIAWNAGMFIGFGLSGVLFEIHPRLAILVAALTMLVTALLLRIPVPPAPPPRSAHTLPLARVPQGRGFRKTAWLSNFAMLFAVGGTVSLFPQLATAWGIPPDQHGALLVLHRVAAVLMVILWPRVRYWQIRLWPLWVAQGLCALGVLVVAVGQSAGMFALGLVLCGAMLGFNYQCSILFTLEEMAEKGKGSGIHEMMLGLGACVGPLAAGWVGQSFGSLRAPYFFCAASMVFWVALQLAVVWWRRHPSNRGTNRPAAGL